MLLCSSMCLQFIKCKWFKFRADVRYQWNDLHFKCDGTKHWLMGYSHFSRVIVFIEALLYLFTLVFCMNTKRILFDCGWQQIVTLYASRCAVLRSPSLWVLLLCSLWFISCVDSMRKRIKLGWSIDFSTDKKNLELHKYKMIDILHLAYEFHSSISVERRRFVTKTEQPFLKHLINF